MSEKDVGQQVDLLDDYGHIPFDRRRFLTAAARILGSASAAACLLPTLASRCVHAAMIAEGDPRVHVERLSFAGATSNLKAYLATPKGADMRAGILVVHQHRGLDPHIEDVARRLASAGYVALAVDFLSPLGGTPNDEAAAVRLFSQLDLAKVVDDAHAGIAFLRARADSNAKVGALGFCWGGGVVNRVAADPVAVRAKNVDAAVVYDGAPPPLDTVAEINAPLLLNYADPRRDARLGAFLPPYEQALKAAEIRFRLYVYEGANRAFNDDTQKALYNESAAKLAWSRSLAFFKDTLA